LRWGAGGRRIGCFGRQDLADADEPATGQGQHGKAYQQPISRRS
jgi:hypothetical protein